MSRHYTIDDLKYLMQRLRDPVDGCPWDLDQDFRSIVPSTIEEAYEVADAIEREDFDELASELGDLLFQVVFYARLAEEQRHFDLEEIVHVLVTKLVRRHPHVFPDGTLESRRGDLPETPDHAGIKASWERIKADERQRRGQHGVLDDVPLNLPALTRAQKLQKRAARVGFDWSDAAPVFDKLDEELAELRDALNSGEREEIEEEVGDLLFTCVNLARHLKLDAESALRRSQHKFVERFAYIEAALAGSGETPEQVSADRLEQLWQEAKQRRD